jgi:hypothetical protein
VVEVVVAVAAIATNAAIARAMKAATAAVSPGRLAWSRGLSASQSAHHFMYISLGHGHLSPEHDTSQYTL